MRNLLQCSNKYTTADTYLYENCDKNTYFLTKPYFSYYYSIIFASSVHNQENNINKTTYKREDNSKKFWDNYYLSLK